VLSSEDWNAFVLAEFHLYELKRVTERTDAPYLFLSLTPGEFSRRRVSLRPPAQGYASD
jgi:hypothetical protein